MIVRIGAGNAATVFVPPAVWLAPATRSVAAFSWFTERKRTTPVDRTSEYENPYQSPVAEDEKRRGVAAVIFRYRVNPATMLGFFGAIAIGVGLFIICAGTVEIIDNGLGALGIDMIVVVAFYLSLGFSWFVSAVCCWRAKWRNAVLLAIAAPSLWAVFFKLVI